MTSYGLDEWFWAMFEPTLTWPNFTFGQLFAGLQKIMIFFLNKKNHDLFGLNQFFFI